MNLKYCNLTIASKDGASNYTVREGMGFQAVSARFETPIEYDCREADCGICIMKVREGIENLSPPTAEEQDFLTAMRADQDERLACQCRIFGNASIEVGD